MRTEKIINRFIKDYNLPSELRFVGEHYSEDNSKKLIRDFIEESLTSDINIIDKKALNKIEKSDKYNIFIFGCINLDYDNLNKILELFGDYRGRVGNEDNLHDILMHCQSNAYYETLTEIQDNFVDFIKKELKNN